MFLIGWKQIAAFINPNLHWQTVRFWHFTRLHLPHTKTYPSQQGRVVASKEVVAAWFKELGKNYKANTGKYLRKNAITLRIIK